MYTKSDCHITDFENAFDRIKNLLINLNVINRKYCFYIKNEINAIDINEFTTIGQQIKHYRQLRGIHQKDVAKYIDRYTMHQIENYKYKQIENPKYMQKIIDFLDIKDKINWNDKYLEFVYLNKQDEIKEFRTKYNISLFDFSNMLKVTLTTLKNWESNKTIISRKSYNKYIEIKTSLENSQKINNETYSYYLFLKNNNLEKIIINYIEKEEITFNEFAKRMNRHPHTIERIIHNKNILTFKQYLKLKELLEKQEQGIKISDPYIEFISSDYHTFIKNLLNEFNVSRAELARQLKVGRTTTEKWIKKEAVISRSNYEKLINFIIKKELHKQVNSLCFIHYILWFWVYIYQLGS